MSHTETLKQQKVALMSELVAGGEGAEAAARRLIEIDPSFPFPYLALGTAKAAAGDLAESESLLWTALRLAPCWPSSYLGLVNVLKERDSDSPLAQAMLLLYLWKLAVSDSVSEAAGGPFTALLESKAIDPTNPISYEMLATAMETSRREEIESPEVQQRLHPYFVLSDLQRQAPFEVTAELVAEIAGDSATYDPLLRAAIRDWNSPSTSLDLTATCLIVALLGEMAGPDAIDQLLSPDLLSEPTVFIHANWAIFRLGQRHPAEAFERLRAAIPAANVAVRCGLAEHLGLLPASPENTAALLSTLDGFSKFAKQPDAGHLLLTVCCFLEDRGDEARVESVLKTYLPLLSKRDRREAEDAWENEDEVIPITLRTGLDELSIEDICLERTLLADEEEDEEDEDGESDEDEEEEEPVPSPKSPARPGRNDFCYCGSRKKYKNCHLAADEAGTAPPVFEPPGTGPALIQEVIRNVSKWQDRDDVLRAFRMFFDEAPRELDQREEAAFMQWLLYDFRAPSSGRTAIEEFRRRLGHQLSAADRARVQAWQTARYGLFEVQRVEEGNGFEVKDVFPGDTFFVHDVSSSKSLVQWDILLMRVETIGGRHELSGDGNMVPRAQFHTLLERIESEAAAAGQDPAAFVRANSHRLHRVVNEICQGWREGLTVRTPEGDAVEFCASTFEILDEPALLDAVRKVSGFEEADPADDDPPGGYHFAWLDDESEGPRRSYGSFEIRDGKLRLECMSRKRLNLGRQALIAHAGSCLKHLGDTIESMQAALARNKGETPKKASKPVPPEIEREVVQKMLDKHYANWPDETLPALDGKTPREAVKSAAGRRAVDDLLRSLENGEARSRREGRAAYDVSKLRKILGFE